MVEQDGLTTYVGQYTRRAPPVAAALAADPRVELAIFQEGERVIVRGRGGAAAVVRAPGHPAPYRYTPIERDVLG